MDAHYFSYKRHLNYLANKEEILRKKKAYVVKNKKRLSLKDKERYKKNRATILLRCKDYYKKNRATILSKRPKKEPQPKPVIQEAHVIDYKNFIRALKVKLYKKQYRERLKLKGQKSEIRTTIPKQKDAHLHSSPSHHGNSRHC